jgi:MATE family multidrug resistance protein
MALQVPMLLIGIGLMMGTVVMTAQAVGAGSPSECGAVWRVSLVHGVTVGTLLMAICLIGEWFLGLVGQGPELARGGGSVLVMLGWGLPAVLMYVATTLFLEGTGRAMPGMVIMLGANLLNAALNWLFIYGNWGMEAMGAEGAALATTIVRWLMVAALVGYALVRLDRLRYGMRGRIPDPWAIGRRLRRIGYPMGLSHGLETSAFSALVLFAGLIGPAHLAGYQLAMNLTALVFMCAIGLATAASVRVATAVGRRHREGVRRAGWVAVALAVLAMAGLGVIFFVVPGSLAAIYTADTGVLAIAIPTIAVAAMVLVVDGSQAVLMGALRGAADVWPATLLYFLSFLGVARGGGAPALMVATGVGCLVATMALAVRFHVVSRRAIVRA